MQLLPVVGLWWLQLLQKTINCGYRITQLIQQQQQQQQQSKLGEKTKPQDSRKILIRNEERRSQLPTLFELYNLHKLPDSKLQTIQLVSVISTLKLK